MIVVEVLMINCQVSEKPKKGPEISQIKITASAIIKAQGEPISSEVFPAIFENNIRMAVSLKLKPI